MSAIDQADWSSEQIETREASSLLPCRRAHTIADSSPTKIYEACSLCVSVAAWHDNYRKITSIKNYGFYTNGTDGYVHYQQAIKP